MRQLREFIHGVESLSVDEQGNPTSQDLQIAAAFLLLFVASADGNLEPAESRVLLLGLEKEFGLERKRAFEIVEIAQAQPMRRQEMEAILETLHSNFDEAQRLRILALVWKVISADGFSSDFENRAAVVIRQRLGLTLEQSAHARRLAEAGDDLTIEVRTTLESEPE